MDEKILAELIKMRKFEEVIEKTQKLNASTDPNYFMALMFRGKAFTNISKYEEASHAFTQVALTTRKFPEASSLGIICNQIAVFGKKYCSFAQRPFDVKSWYEQVMRQILKTESFDISSSSIADILVDGEAYILGPPDTVNSFKGFDVGVKFCIRNSIDPFPLAQIDHLGIIYQNDQSLPLPYYQRKMRHDVPVPVARFPTTSWIALRQFTRISPGCDVFSADWPLDPAVHALLRSALDKIADESRDVLVPMYQHIIDPNRTAVRRSLDGRFIWTATDAFVEAHTVFRREWLAALQAAARRWCGGVGLPLPAVRCILHHLRALGASPCLGCRAQVHLASPAGGLDPAGHADLQVALEAVLAAAVPMLGALRRPALLLPGPVQVVVKAQRVFLGPGEEYTGVWHADGLRERVAAVVLYYYRVSPALRGGDMEFMARRPATDPVWQEGGAGFPAIGPRDVGAFVGQTPRCRAGVRAGTMLVFSNCQMVHRVLRMHHPPGGGGAAGFRDVLAFFIIDQRDPLPSSRLFFPVPPPPHPSRADGSATPTSGDDPVEGQQGDDSRIRSGDAGADGGGAARDAVGGVHCVAGSACLTSTFGLEQWLLRERVFGCGSGPNWVRQLDVT